MKAIIVFIALFFIQQTTAAMTINIVETGGNVQATLSGSLNLDATHGEWLPGSFSYNGFSPTTGNIGFNFAEVDTYYIDFAMWTPFGTGSLDQWDSSSGDAWHIAPDPLIAVPDGYLSGDTLSATATKNNATFASLGFTPGTYVTTLTNDDTTDTVTVNIGIDTTSTPIPTLGIWYLVVLSVLLWLLAMKAPISRRS